MGVNYKFFNVTATYGAGLVVRAPRARVWWSCTHSPELPKCAKIDLFSMQFNGEPGPIWHSRKAKICAPAKLRFTFENATHLNRFNGGSSTHRFRGINRADCIKAPHALVKFGSSMVAFMKNLAENPARRNQNIWRHGAQWEKLGVHGRKRSRKMSSEKFHRYY